MAFSLGGLRAHGAGRGDPRECLARAVSEDFRMLRAELGRGAPDPRVLDALKSVPRDRFVPESDRDRAWDNTALPIGGGQTISQPFIVALMTDMIRPGPRSKLLEIGTGCGYQAAVLAELAGEVYSVERLPELAATAHARLGDLGYENIHLTIGDGMKGWPEHAPYDGILVTAAAPAMPSDLAAQLAPGGVMAIPLGPEHGEQTLSRVTRDQAGEITVTPLIPVRFVPLRPGEG